MDKEKSRDGKYRTSNVKGKLTEGKRTTATSNVTGDRKHIKR
jgi:hypothetical protein